MYEALKFIYRFIFGFHLKKKHVCAKSVIFNRMTNWGGV